MKITGVETFCLDYRMPYPLTYARGEYQTREALLVKVHTDDPDIFGWGEAAMWGGPWATSVDGHREGDRAADRRPRSAAARNISGRRSTRRPTTTAARAFCSPACPASTSRSGTSSARPSGQPVWRLLGGFARPLRAYASSGYYRRDYSVDDLADDVAKARADGYRGYKMKVGNIAAAVHARVLHETPLRVTLRGGLRPRPRRARSDRQRSAT